MRASRPVPLGCILGAVALLGASRLLAADWWVDAQAAGESSGSREQPFKTIQAAAQVAQPGDTVRVLPGVYRERVMPARGGQAGKPIVYRSQIPHAAVVKGSDVWSPDWRSEGDGLFSGELDPALFTDRDYVDGGNPYRIAYDWDRVRNNRPPHPYKQVDWTLGQVFVEGVPLLEMSSRTQLAATPQSWWFDPASGRVLLNLGGARPPERAVELTTRRGVFRPKLKGLGYIEIHGFVFEHCANQFPAQFWKLQANAQSGMVGTRAGHHWVIAGNIFRHAKSIGLSFGMNGKTDDYAGTFDNETGAETAAPTTLVGFHRIEANRFERNGAIGAMGAGHKGVVFRGNVFSRNNALGNNAYEIGGIKTHHAVEMRVEGNWFLDNECMGVWLDNTWRNCRISRNIFLGNRGKNLFFEMDDNTPATASTVDCNLFLPGRPTLVPQTGDDGVNPSPSSPWAVGVYGHDADGIRIVQNLFFGEGYGLYFRKMTARKGGASHLVATGNLFIGDSLTAACLPAPNLAFAKGNFFDGNVYPQPPTAEAAHSVFVATAWTSGDGRTERHSIESLQQQLGGNLTKLRPFGKTTTVPAGFFLRFDEWKSTMAFDRHSVAAPVRCQFDPDSWELTLEVPAAALRPRAVGAGVKLDFFEQPFQPAIVAGPFAFLRAGRQTIAIPAPEF